MTQQRRVFLDNHSTTRVDPRVVDAMMPYLIDEYGNPGSINHAFGEVARQAVDLSRQTIADSIGSSPREIVFTSGATESNNLAIRGSADSRRRRGDHIVSVRTEHRAVLDPLDLLSRRGFRITWLDVEQDGGDHAGRIDVDQLADSIGDETCLVSIMLANNEIGVIQPIDQIAAICQDKGVLFHCDATQAVGKIPVDVVASGIDLMSFTAHKFYGPKGVGALYVRRKSPRIRLEPAIVGGGQESGLRSGTLNVPGIVGLAAALQIGCQEQKVDRRRLKRLRDDLFNRLLQEIDGVQLNGPRLDEPEIRLSHNLNCSFAGVDGEALMMNTGGLAVSSGSACTSANPEPSHVLRALGIDDDRVRASLRFGLGRFNDEADIDFAIETLRTAVSRLRSL